MRIEVRRAFALVSSLALHAALFVLLWRAAWRPPANEKIVTPIDIIDLAEPPAASPAPPASPVPPPSGGPPGRIRAGGAPAAPPGRAPDADRARGGAVSEPPAPAPPVPRARPLDLSLHAVPGEAPPAAGPSAAPAPPAGRAPWHPRGHVPLFGEITFGPAREPYRLPPPGSGGTRIEDARFYAQVDPDGATRIDDRATFDLTDAIMRRAHQDPYAYEKRRFLAATSSRRDALAEAARAARTREALDALPHRLLALWRDGSRSAAERRRLLWELWEEADGESEAGARARRLIETFIQNRLPAGSPDAFSEAELLRYGFRPYPDRPVNADRRLP